MSLPGFSAEAAVYKLKLNLTNQKEECVMNMPGFTAENSLYKTVELHRFARTSSQIGEAFPAFWPIDPPDITLTWQPFPSTLTITGENFAPDSDVLLTIDNCDAFRDRTLAHTTKRSDP